MSNPTRALKAALSPRFMRRTATVDTNMISKEEYEVSLWRNGVGEKMEGGGLEIGRSEGERGERGGRE